MCENLPRFMSIKEVANTGIIREYTLRRLVKQGKIPCIYSGNKCLINYTLLIERFNEIGGIENEQ